MKTISKTKPPLGSKSKKVAELVAQLTKKGIPVPNLPMGSKQGHIELLEAILKQREPWAAAPKPVAKAPAPSPAPEPKSLIEQYNELPTYEEKRAFAVANWSALKSEAKGG